MRAMARIALALGIGFASALLTTTGADARSVKVLRCNENGFCTYVVIDVPDDKPSVKPVRAKSTRCVDATTRQEVKCTGDPRGRWSNRNQCFIKRPSVVPAKSDPAWQEHRDGSVWSCTRTGYGFTGNREAQQLNGLIWLPAGVRPTVVVDPMVLVRQAIAKMQLGRPRIGIVPKPTPAANQGAVNLPVWMWTERGSHDLGPLTATAELPGVLSVTAEATVTRIVWTMGDGGSVTCAGPGTEFDPSYGVTMSPTCGYRYERTSRDEPGGRYTVTARSDWTVHWTSSDGDSGDIAQPLSSDVSIRIGELRPVLVAPDR